MTADYFVSGLIYQWFIDILTKIRDTLREFVNKTELTAEQKYLLEGNAEVAQKLLDRFLDAVGHAAENVRKLNKNASSTEAETKSETKSDTTKIRNKIIVSSNGQSVVWIDKNILKGQNNNAEKVIENYLKQNIGTVYTLIESGQSVYLGDDLPTEYTHSTYTQNLQNNPSVLRAKNKAVTGLGEMIEIATNRKWEQAKHTHNKDAKYGVYRYDTKFAFPVLDNFGNITSVKAFDAKLLILNSSDGKKYLYDLISIKRNTALSVDLTKKKTRPAKQVQRNSVSNNNIPQPKQNVKHTNQIKISDESYLSAVRTGDTEKLQQMVDEAARQAGYTVDMWHGSPAQFTVFDRKRAKSMGAYGNGFYFTDSESIAGLYGNKYKVKLKIENPLKSGGSTATRDNLKKFREAVAENEDYSIENYGTYDTEQILDMILEGNTEKDAFAVIQDVNATAIGNFSEAVELYNSTVGTTYDAIETPTETVVFNPEQIKSAEPVIYDDNGNVIPLSKRFDSTKKDIRNQVKIRINPRNINRQAIDYYTEDEYNRYGWAVVNGIVPASSIREFRRRLAELWQISHNKRINVVRIPGTLDTFYFKGGFTNPTIVAAYSGVADYEDYINPEDYDTIERIIRNYGRKGKYSSAVENIGITLGKRLVYGFAKEDCPDYGQIEEFREHGELASWVVELGNDRERSSGSDTENRVGRNQVKVSIEGLDKGIDPEITELATEYLGDIGTTLLPGERVDPKAIARNAEKVLKEYESKLSKDILTKDLSRLYEMIADRENPELIHQTANYIADKILRNSKNFKPVTYESQAILDDIRRVPVKLSTQQKNILKERYGMDYDAFVIANADDLNLDKGGVPISERWDELAELYPDTFDKDAPKLDVPILLSNIAIEMGTNYHGELSFDDEVVFLGLELMGLTDEMTVDTKTKYERQISELKQKHKERVSDIRDRQRRGHLVKMITKRVKRMQKLLTEESDDKHIPERLKPLVADYISSFTDKGIFSAGKAALLSLYFAETNIEESNADFNEELTAQLNEAIELMQESGEAKLTKMSVDVLEAVRNATDMLNRAISNENTEFASKRAHQRAERGEETLEMLHNMGRKKVFKNEWLRGKAAGVQRLISTNNMAPQYFFEDLGGPFYDLYNELLEAQNSYAKRTLQAKTMLLKAKEDCHYLNWYKDKISVSIGGRSREMAIGKVMTLWATAKRQRSNKVQNARHLQEGGVVDSDEVEIDTDEKKVTSINDKNGKKIIDLFAFKASKATPMSDEEIDALDLKLTDEQKRYVDRIVEFMSTVTQGSVL